MEEDINKLIEELTNIRPDELSAEGLKLFNKINEIIDKNKELKENSIPVSLVEEKIEELNKEEKELQDSITEEEREEYSDASISYGLMLIENQRKVLQELLEKR